jgi:hypothetical protein
MLPQHDQRYNLRPDALAVYRVGSQQVCFWLEWDCSTINVRDLAIKFTSYAHYIASREWAREHSNSLVPYFLLEPGRRERSRRLGERTSDSQANRRSHIGVVVAMIGKGASYRKRMTKGATNGDGPAIKRCPVVTGDRMGC